MVRIVRLPRALLGVWALASAAQCAATQCAATQCAATQCAAATASANAAPQTNDAELTLVVSVTGLRNDSGHVAIAVFDNSNNFPKQERALRGATAKIVEGTANVSFPHLAAGRYAVAVLHDENTNHRMDFNWLGMPREGFGFSRDAKVRFGPPSFEAAAFGLTSSHRIGIRARYFSL
jgi:uncharacterized protein (DUF2141 family)